SAPIKRQCSKDYFYGKDDVEDNLGGIEGQSAEIYRKLIDIARTGDTGSFTQKNRFRLDVAILVQRARTLYEVKKCTAATNSLMLKMFLHHLRSKPDTEKAVAILENGGGTIVPDLTEVVRENLRIMIEHAPDICDLSLSLLRNRTSKPFIFS